MREEQFVKVDKNRVLPLYYQVSEFIEELIKKGEILPAERMLSEEVLAERFGVSRPTINKAIAILLRKSVLTRERGKGTRIVQVRTDARACRVGQAVVVADDLRDARGERPAAERVVHQVHGRVVRVVLRQANRADPDDALVGHRAERLHHVDARLGGGAGHLRPVLHL